MPQALPAIGALAAGTTAATATTMLLTAAVNIAAGLAMNLLTKALTKKPRQGLMPLNLTVRSTIPAKQVVLGRKRVGGAVLFSDVSGTNNKYLWYVIAYAGHQCNDLQDCWLDNRKIADADINGTTGVVSTASLFGKIYIWNHLGTQAQTVDSNLDSEFSDWTSNHRLRGICYRVFRLERSDNAFPSGAPQNFSSLVEGAKVYDPRLDSTNGGSGSHRRDDPQTWAFSRNWALNLRWYLSGGSVVNDQATRLIMYGLKESDDRIDDDYTIAAANVADQSLSGANAPPSGAQERYTLDIEISCEESRLDVLEDILIAGGFGQLIRLHGMWRMYAGAYDAPAHTFTQNDLFTDDEGTLDPFDFEDTSGPEDRFNHAAGIYVDEEKDHTEQTTPVRTDSAYVTQDAGKQRTKELSLRGVSNQYRAQRIVELWLRKSRQMRLGTLRFGRQGLAVAPWETIDMSHTGYGWTNRIFRCLEREEEVTEQGGVLAKLLLGQETASIYTDLVTADYETGTSVTNALQSDEVDAPTNLTAIALLRAIDFNWELGEFWELNGISELWEADTDSFGSASRIWYGRASRVVIQKTDWTPRYYWVRVRTINDEVSDTEPATNGLLMAALPQKEIILDPFFALATDGTYWGLYEEPIAAGPATGISIVATGGISGGYLELVGDSTDKSATALRASPYPVITGQQIRITVRWKRTGTITSGAGTDIALGIAGGTSGGAPPLVAAVLTSPIQKTVTQVNAATVNEWQEDSATLTVPNNVKSMPQYPYLVICAYMEAGVSGGTIHVDSIDANVTG